MFTLFLIFIFTYGRPGSSAVEKPVGLGDVNREISAPDFPSRASTSTSVNWCHRVHWQCRFPHLIRQAFLSCALSTTSCLSNITSFIVCFHFVLVFPTGFQLNTLQGHRFRTFSWDWNNFKLRLSNYNKVWIFNCNILSSTLFMTSSWRFASIFDGNFRLTIEASQSIF